LLKNMGKNKSLNLPYPLILASTSKYRSELLSQLGWPFEAIAPGIDEEQLKTEGLLPDELAIELSRLKAKAIYVHYEGSCVIGSDQVCTIGNKIFDKPGSVEKAIEQLLEMQGKTHQLLTAVTIITPENETTFLNTTTLHMRDLSYEEIKAYVESDRPLDCAGSYKLESGGIKLFERIEMSDHTAIIGLPLIELSNVLIGFGYPI
jgi:septum formation protein